jgi:hypothetical protein
MMPWTGAAAPSLAALHAAVAELASKAVAA